MLWTSYAQYPPAPLALALLAAAAETAGALSGIAATVPSTPRGGFICNYRRERGRDERGKEGRKEDGSGLRRRQGEGRRNFMPNMVIGTVMKCCLREIAFISMYIYSVTNSNLTVLKQLVISYVIAT